jgi:hypothetical protein
MKIQTRNLATENTEFTEMAGETSKIRWALVRSRRIKCVGEQAARCSAIAFSVNSVFSVAKGFSK